MSAEAPRRHQTSARTTAWAALSPLAPLLQPPRRARLQVVVWAVAAVTLALVFAGWTAAEVVTSSLALLVAGVLVASLPGTPEHRWRFELPPSEPGGRSDLVGLSVAFTARQSGMGQAGLVRVQALGRSRLRRRGVDLDAPGGRAVAEELLGRAAVAVLLSRSSPTPRVRAVAHCLARVEALGSGAAPAPSTRPPIDRAGGDA
ncbi:hypothetical protein [Quadrisphaera sp. INWT6]|uniref:hypothetical protein n=1 Tax=Quadrisphaera sp. INWT6 TaxID=2596917 RepID=UPI00189217E4|nr:hypothetical protein [Quadrisphaera sp. INWT6]MBF5080743.1 hypothetical protein [Quadrisphaera sp. INWT6]